MKVVSTIEYDEDMLDGHNYDEAMRIKEQNKLEQWKQIIDPTHTWKTGTPPTARFARACSASKCPEIVEMLKQLSYSDFLRTPYWKAVSQRIRHRYNGICQNCGTNHYDVHVHHKTYEHHGQEALYLYELTLLCAKCHELNHGKEINEI